MAYRLFEQKAVKMGTPAITITTGRFIFNADAGDIFSRVGVKHVHILWDFEKNKIGLRPTAKADGNSYKITFVKGKRGAALAARFFLNHIQWNSESPLIVPVTWNEKEKLLEGSLPKDHIGSKPLKKMGHREQ